MAVIFKMLQRICSLLFVLILLISCKGEVVEKESGHEFTNALVNETSPYLLQHAHNPVDWRPWSEDALQDAKKENKLVLISIGYSSCHWCHVMEEETFEDEEVARLMNENYVSIKVDREERPDVDHIYQTFVQLIDQNGGWPLNVIALPNGKPLYGGTYHTKEQWSKVLTDIHKLYIDDPVKANEYADMVAAGVQEANIVVPVDNSGGLTKDDLEKSLEGWRPNWDLEWGGDTGREKFMLPVNLNFLLDYALLTDDNLTKAHVKNTLDKMAMGGVYDHVGGGFFRYSTDNRWKVPHFEKMLYDNAQLLSLYAKAHQVFKDPRYHQIVIETAEFLEREMSNNEGAFHAAIDADSEGEEGKFYIWKIEELRSILKDDFPLFSKYYNVEAEAVWEEDNYILHKKVGDSTFIEKNDISARELDLAKTRWKKVLLTIRGQRIRPKTDDKIITSWNALLINGYVDAYKAFGNEEFLKKAEDIFLFLQKNNFRDEALVHTYKKGSKLENSFIEDYAFLIDAVLNLYGVTLEEAYLNFAQDLNSAANDLFFDDTSRMYRYNQGQELISKILKTNDGVIPSPNAIMAHNLFKLGHIEYNLQFLERSKQMLLSMAPAIRSDGAAYAKWSQLHLLQTHAYFEIVIVGKNAHKLTQSVNSNYLPNAIIVGSKAESDLPLFKDRYEADATYIYVCQNSTCKLPVKTVEKAMEQMAQY